MIQRLIFLLFLLVQLSAVAQSDSEDWAWWNELHNWQVGDPGWRSMIIISPGYMGPNALPVPEVKKGILSENAEIEITGSNHFHKDDPTRDLSGKVYVPFAKGRIAVEMYGVLFEQFSFSERIRNERYSRIKDGKGTAIGDFYFSTLIQLWKNKKFPNTLFRFATKTASGNQLEGARYSDSPGYFFDLSLSKDFNSSGNTILRPFGLIGFYTWQTNDELNLQNDALLYAAGMDIVSGEWLMSGSLSGYSGYKNQRDKPVQFNLELRRELGKKAVSVRYVHGIRHWEYKTVRFSFIWKLAGVGE